MRAEPLHERDLALVDMALLSCPLNADGSQFFRRVFENRRHEIAQTEVRQEFRVERILRHFGFIQNLMIPDHRARTLAAQTESVD